MNETIDQVSMWLSNHELLSLLLIVAIFAAGIAGFCRWMSHGIIPDEDDEPAKNPGVGS